MYHDISRITPRTRKYRDLLDSIVSHTSSRHKQKPWARFWVNAQAWMMRTYNIPRCSHFGNKIRPCFELPSKHKLGIPSDAVLPGGFASGTLVQGGPACSFAAPAMSYYGLPPTKFANEYNEFEKLLRVRRWWKRERGPNCGGLESLQCPAARCILPVLLSERGRSRDSNIVSLLV